MSVGIRSLTMMAAFTLTAAALPAVAQEPDTAPTDAASLGLTELTDDLSRQELFGEIQAVDRLSGNVARADAAIQSFNLNGPFRFPGDTKYDSMLGQPRVNSFFGVDISHYTSASFPIELLKARNVRFLYMKATQGAEGLDGKFAGFWKRTGALPAGKQVHRGAYHFLSACEHGDCHSDPVKWGKRQADTFIKVVMANGGLLPTDMPPVVDLEWDKASANAPDRWASRTPQEIVKVVDAFLIEVKEQLHRTPMIYTANAWWSGQMKSTPFSATMKASPIWLADYSKSSRASENPRSIGTAKWALWQFTEKGVMATGFTDGFDANIYKGSLPALYQTLGVREFAQ